jgi:hypothetical protein
MNPAIRQIWPVVLALCAGPDAIGGGAGAPASPAEPSEPRLRAHVAALASPALEGRRGTGGVKAAEYVASEFKKLGLAPLFDGSFFQDVPGNDRAIPPGRNVGALLRGNDARLRDEWIILSAHFDHLGLRNGVLYPGADDNASGVAMLLEVARSLIEGKAPLKRSIAFVSFDLEEVGLYGSRYFVEHPAVPIERVALFITADMLGRSLGGVCGSYVFVMGSEHAPATSAWLESAAKGSKAKLGVLGSDLLLINRSDYGPFRARKVPYLFFSTGENPVYHTPRDVPETLDYPKLEAASRIILRIVRAAAESEKAPVWTSPPVHPFAEAVTIRDVMRTLMDNRETLKIGPAQVLLMTNALRKLDAIVERGTITPEERAGAVQAARIILISVF